MLLVCHRSERSFRNTESICELFQLVTSPPSSSIYLVIVAGRFYVDFLAVDPNYWAVFLVRASDLKRVLSAVYYIVVELIPREVNLERSHATRTPL